MAENRKPVRKGLATAMAADITAVAATYDHKPINVGGATPVLAIESVSSERTAVHFGGLVMIDGVFRFLIHIFVRRPDTGSSWTKAQADDQLDDIEAAVAGFVESNQEGDLWSSITIIAATVIDDNVELDGSYYINEQILIEVSPR